MAETGDVAASSCLFLILILAPVWCFEVPAFLRMESLMSRERMDVPSERGEDGAFA